MRKIKIENQSKKKAAMVISAIILVLGILLIVPVVTNYSVTLTTAIGLALMLTLAIAIASILEDVIDNFISPKGIAGVGEIIIVIILAVVVLTVLGPYVGLTASSSVQAWMLIVTIVADRVSNVASKVLKL